jgi:hypothetical protein
MHGLRMSRERKRQIQSWRDGRREAWEEEDRKAQIGQMVVYNGSGELLPADELCIPGQFFNNNVYEELRGYHANT